RVTINTGGTGRHARAQPWLRASTSTGSTPTAWSSATTCSGWCSSAGGSPEGPIRAIIGPHVRRARSTATHTPGGVEGDLGGARTRIQPALRRSASRRDRQQGQPCALGGHRLCDGQGERRDRELYRPSRPPAPRERHPAGRDRRAFLLGREL